MDTWQLDSLDGLDAVGFLSPGSAEAAGFPATDVLPDVPSVAPQRAAVPASAFSSQPDGGGDAALVQPVQQAAHMPPFPPTSAASPGPGGRGDMPPLPPPQSVRAASSAQAYGGSGFRSDAGERRPSGLVSLTPRICNLYGRQARALGALARLRGPV